MKREYLLGGNTSRGFCSYYDYLVDSDSVDRIYVIKGGPGTGKSSTMKKVADWCEQRGYDVDLIRCSADPASLDGIVAKGIGIAMVDGTSPHVVEPKNFGAVEVILDMGQFLDFDKIKQSKKEISSLGKEISLWFKRAYNYLAASEMMWKNCICRPAEKQVNEICKKIAGEIPKIGRGQGKARKLFAEAVTADGVVSYAHSVCCRNRVILKSEICGGACFVLKKIQYVLSERGFDTEVFYSPLNPIEEIRHIVIPELDLSIHTSDIMSIMDERDAVVVDVDALADFCPETFSIRSSLLSTAALSQAVTAISRAKKLHDELEGYYVPCMDFEGMESMRKKIFEYLEQVEQIKA